MTNYRAMTTEELNVLRDKYHNTLETASFSFDYDAWDIAYTEYTKICEVLDDRWREENKPDLDNFFIEHIEGRRQDEINPNDWDFYSDWHKDVYGFRPRLKDFC